MLIENLELQAMPPYPMGMPMEVDAMNNDDRTDRVESESTSNAPSTDTAGKPVDEIEKDLEDKDNDARSVEQANEQEAEELRRKIAEIERKVADGN